MWIFTNIPDNQKEEVRKLHELGEYREIILRFVSWGVISNYCDSCPLSGYIRDCKGWVEYAIFNEKI